VFPKLSIKPLRDLVAVGQVVDVPSVLLVHTSVPASTVRELVDYAKANQGKLNFASPGSGSLDRLEMELFRKLEKLDMVHVPYKGGAGPAVAGLMGGETNLMFATAASAMPGIKSGRVKPLAVTSPKRIESLPNVPTVHEAGYPDLAASSWQGIFVPAERRAQSSIGSSGDPAGDEGPGRDGAPEERRRRGGHQRKPGRLRELRRGRDRALGADRKRSERHARLRVSQSWNAPTMWSANARAAAVAARPEGNTACTSTEPISQSGRSRTRCGSRALDGRR